MYPTPGSQSGYGYYGNPQPAQPLTQQMYPPPPPPPPPVSQRPPPPPPPQLPSQIMPTSDVAQSFTRESTGEPEVKKRKSNFDVLPEEVGRNLAKVVAQINDAVETAPFVPATEPVFIQRLERALQKNLDYIRRKDGKLPPTHGRNNSRASLQHSHGFGSNGDPGAQYGGSSDLYARAEGSRGGLGDRAAAQQDDAYASSTYQPPAHYAHTAAQTFVSAGRGAAVKQEVLTPASNAYPAAATALSSASSSSSIRPCVENAGTNTGPSALSILRDALPPECQAHKYPVVLLFNVYDPAEAYSDPNFFMDLEADMLLECCKFGKVVVLLSPEGNLLEGCIAVTFEEAASVRECASALHGRWFDGRELEARILYPEPPGRITTIQSSSAVHQLQAYGSDGEGSPSWAGTSTGSVNVDIAESKNPDEVTKDVQDVEDFLNSLL